MAESQTLQPSPRWLYAFLNWLKRTPLNGWLVAAILLGLGILFIHWPLWQAGLRTPYQIAPALIFPATWFPLGIIFWLWQDRIASSAISDFGKGVGKSEKEVRLLYTRFISLGERPSLLLAVVGLFFGGSYQVQQSMFLGIVDPLWIFLFSLIPTLGSMLELIALIRILSQLSQVNSLYKGVKKINLFNLWPIYALSRYGYRLALFFILSAVATDLAIRFEGGVGLPIFSLVYTAAFAVLVFVAPLLGINARLRREKQNDLQRLGVQLNSVYADTEAAIRSRKLSKVTDLKMAGNALREQMEAVQKVATLPWNPGSLRNLLLPVLLPLFIAILQRYVLTFLGL